jgi:two-component system LytT family sensor kinase
MPAFDHLNDPGEPSDDDATVANPRVVTLVAIWSVFAWYTALNVEATAFINGTPYPGWRAIVPGLAEWYLWVPLTPIVLWLAARYPLIRRRRWQPWLVHVSAVFAITLIRGLVYASTTLVIARAALPLPIGPYLIRIFIGYLPFAAAIYGAILAVQTAAAYASRSRADTLRAARLETQLARAEFAALKSNVHPHFLFNALHSVGALVRARDHDGAVQVITELSELLRAFLRRDAPDEIPLRDELALVERYLTIERVRFRDRLDVQWDIAPETMDAGVPRLILQPLAENAIRHGIGQSSAAGRVTVAATRRGDWLELAVSDDGPGPSGVISSNGIGLTTARARLLHAYGPDAGVTLTRAPTGGAEAVARLPFRHV